MSSLCFAHFYFKVKKSPQWALESSSFWEFLQYETSSVTLVWNPPKLFGHRTHLALESLFLLVWTELSNRRVGNGLQTCWRVQPLTATENLFGHLAVPSVNFLNLVTIIYVAEILHRAPAAGKAVMAPQCHTPQRRPSNPSDDLTRPSSQFVSHPQCFILQVHTKFWCFFNWIFPYFPHFKNRSVDTVTTSCCVSIVKRINLSIFSSSFFIEWITIDF